MKKCLYLIFLINLGLLVLPKIGLTIGDQEFTSPNKLCTDNGSLCVPRDPNTPSGCPSESSVTTGVLCPFGQVCCYRAPVTVSPPTEQTKVSPIAPILQIKIPGLAPFNPKDVKKVEIGGKPYIEVPFIAQYITALYKYGISISFVFAVVLIMIAGFRWMTAGGNTATIGQAKTMISSAVIGVILLFGSYFLLFNINPDLVKSGTIRIRYIEADRLRAERESTENEPNEGALPSGSCAEGNLQNLSDIQGLEVKASDPRLLPDAKEALRRATEAAASEGYALRVQSAHRSLARQQEIWDQNLNSKYNGDVAETRKAVCEPKCGCPHTTGKVVDVCISGLTGCGLSYKEFKSRNYQLKDAEKTLDRIMKSAGFIRYCKEWWHFEYQTGRTGNVC